MNDPRTLPLARDHRLWVKVLAGVLLAVALVALLLVFFPWDVLRGPLNRYVSSKTGRHFEITRKLDVQLGRTIRILADGIEFANPEWAQNPHLLQAEGAEIQIELLPLLRRRIELPVVALHKPQLGLQIEADGRRSWALGRDTSDPANIPEIGVLVVDNGSAHLVATHYGADIRTDFTVAGPLAMRPAPNAPHSGSPTAAMTAESMPLSFNAKGTWQKEPFTARGRTGNVLYLSAPLQRPFPMELDARAGRTTLRANGSVASLATLDRAHADFSLQGFDLSDLYKLIGVVLPATPRYSLQGRLSREGEVWHVRQIDGKLGNSDLKGELSFDRSQKVPLLSGKVRSVSLDFDDLAPLVGLPEQPRSAAAHPQLAGAPPGGVRAAPARNATGGKVLPTAVLDVDRLKRMNADVSYEAARIRHVKQLPLDRMSVHVRLKDGGLNLDPLQLGVATGSLAGRVSIDSSSKPALAEVHLDARSLELNKLFPSAEITRGSFGKLHGDIDLKGRGNSVAQMLGSSSGAIAMLMGKGQISNLLMEVAGLDGAEILKFLMAGDENVQLRCAAAAFDVKNGLMSSRALVLDTSDTVIYGQGQISLASEAMDLTLRPYPKDMSILSLRSPLKIAGTFGDPQAGPDKGSLAGRAGLTLALAAVNPLLALAATVETGPGRDANCGPALREASSSHAAARIAAMSQPPAPRKESSKLGGPSANGVGSNAKDRDAKNGPGRNEVARDSANPAAGPVGKEARQHAPIAPDRPYGQ
jgi:AsmA family protein